MDKALAILTATATKVHTALLRSSDRLATLTARRCKCVSPLPQTLDLHSAGLETYEVQYESLKDGKISCGQQTRPLDCDLACSTAVRDEVSLIDLKHFLALIFSHAGRS